MSYQGNVYRAKTAHVEEQLASAIHQQMKYRKMHSYGDLDAAIDAEEQKLKMKFALEQREAVKMALTQGLSIITGGPGTGKTLIQRAILDIYQNNPKMKSAVVPLRVGQQGGWSRQLVFRLQLFIKPLG